MHTGPSRDPPASFRDIFQWEVRTWSRAYPMWSIALRPMIGRGRRALALGERDGGLSLLLAELGFATLCTDLGGPTDAARQLHRNHGVEGLMTYAAIDALAIDQPDEAFDVVVFKSMIGALGSKEKQARALQEMHRVMKPGGMLLFAENLKSSWLHSILRRRFAKWSSYWRYIDRRQDMDLFAPFNHLETHTTGFLSSFGRTETQRDVLARMDSLLMPLIPMDWRTVMYGVAIK